MIRISRGPEPEKLQDNRWVYLARAELDHGQGNSISFSGYDVAKHDLWNRQFKKCVFCEMPIVSPAGQPVEHFRPKGRAIREDGKQAEGYWWLAWSWDNLLFACVTCNTAFKRDLFPLENDRDALDPGSKPPGDEVPLLIDPSSEDPMEHIQFTEVRKGRWYALPRKASKFGENTIEITGINSLAHRDYYADHAASPKVANRLEDVLQAMDASVPERPDAVKRQWRKLCEELFYKAEPLHAFTYWIVDKHFPSAVRETWGISLPRLGNFAPSPTPADRSNPSLEGLTRTLALRCRALGSRPKRDVLGNLLIDLCAHSPKRLDQLVEMIELSTTKVNGLLGELEQDGRLSRDASGRYR